MCDSFGPQCNTSGPEEINFIEVKVKALRSVLTPFEPIETAWNVCKDSTLVSIQRVTKRKKSLCRRETIDVYWKSSQQNHCRCLTPGIMQMVGTGEETETDRLSPQLIVVLWLS